MRGDGGTVSLSLVCHFSKWGPTLSLLRRAARSAGEEREPPGIGGEDGSWEACMREICSENGGRGVDLLRLRQGAGTAITRTVDAAS